MLELSSSLQDTGRFLKALLEIPDHGGKKKKKRTGEDLHGDVTSLNLRRDPLNPEAHREEAGGGRGVDGEPARVARLPRCPAPSIRLPARHPTEPQTDLERRGLDLRGPSEESHSLYF